MRKKLKPDGFTLIELVVVMAIVSTLTALATFNFNLARVRARDIQRKSELKQIQNALEIFKNDQMPQTYPTSADFATALIPAYMAKLPVDPKEKATAGSWMDYTYSQVTAATYTLEACLENSGDPDRLIPAVVCGAGSAGYIYQLTQP
ncbi:MAG: General secretion pathway protein G [Parcubacteria group bacterium GW2011_GWB1_52_7]|nr:MAG: General secretion pathway protein G [Parcubacteria group bacterium GW2011_GWB1_52_7]